MGDKELRGRRPGGRWGSGAGVRGGGGGANK